MITLLALLLSATSFDYAFGADKPLPDCQIEALAQRLLKKHALIPIAVDLKDAADQLQLRRARPQPSPIYMGVSEPLPANRIDVRPVGGVKQSTRADKSGIVVRCSDSTLFATSISVPTAGYFVVTVSGDDPTISRITVVDSSNRVSTTNFVAPVDKSSSVVALTEGFAGPLAVLIVEAPRKVHKFSISLKELIVIDWPADPQALIPGNWSPARAIAATAAPTNKSTPELDAAKAVVGPKAINDPAIPADFLDYECMKNHNLFNRFPADLRNHVNAIGLLEATVWDGQRKSVNYCTATLVTFDRNAAKRTFVLTGNHCFVGEQKRDAVPGDIVSAKVYWDYRNPQCTSGPPARWAFSDIHNLPSTDVQLVSATAISDSAILNPTTAPADRVPLQAGGTPDYTANNVFRMRFHHADLRPLLGSEPYWDWKSEPGFPIGGYSGACEAGEPALNFFYSMWVVHSQSSAMAKGASGSAVIDQRGNVVGQLWGWCFGAMSSPGPFYNYDVDGKIERTLNILGLP